jgi:hypothetical protein
MNQQLIEQYVAGKLSEAEAEAFEDSFVANRDLARLVELEQRLKDGLALVASGSTEEFVRAENPLPWKLALAASVLLCVGTLAWVGKHLSGLHPQLLAAVTTEEQRTGTSMRLALIRGADGMPQLPGGTVRVEIVGLFEPELHYTVALDRIEPNQGITTLSTLYGEHPTSPVTLEVMIDGKQLESGSYFIRVRKQASDEEALDFTFVKP